MLINNDTIEIDEIESIEFVGDKPTKDISIDSEDRLFFCNGIYVHNSASENDIITGENVAESYKKIMTGDVVISMSRKIEDKLANTARCHIIKNRYGIDGITLPAKVDTSVGKIDIFSPESVNGMSVNREMKNSNEVLKKTLSQKYKDYQSETGSSIGEGFE